MSGLLIVYHTQSGSCARLAAAAADGARAEGSVAVTLRRACDAGVADLAAADGLLLVAAENSGSLSGGAKDFLDRVFYPAIERGLVKPYGLLISAGNDGRGAVAQAQRILRGIPFTAAAEPLILRGEVGEEQLAAARDSGTALAAGLGMGIF
jgi:multimeric flavodoxin WrbA